MSEITKVNSNRFFIKSKSSMNGELVNELKRLRLTTIGQKTVWSLILTTTQISDPTGYPIWVLTVFN